jgi:hypothetical protein
LEFGGLADAHPEYLSTYVENCVEKRRELDLLVAFLTLTHGLNLIEHFEAFGFGCA